MSLVNKKYISDFTFSNLDDVDTASLQDGFIIAFDQTLSKWVSVSTNTIPIFIKRIYTNAFTLPEGATLAVPNPVFDGDLELEAGTVLEVLF